MKDFALFHMFQTVKELDWGKLASIEKHKWSYSTVVMKRDMNGTKTAHELVQRFETFLTKVARERLGLTEETKEPAGEKVDGKTEK